MALGGVEEAEGELRGSELEVVLGLEIEARGGGRRAREEKAVGAGCRGREGRRGKRRRWERAEEEEGR